MNMPTIDPRPEAWRNRMPDTPRMLREIADTLGSENRFSAQLLRMLADDTVQMMRDGVLGQPVADADVVAAYRASYPMGDPRLNMAGKAVHHVDGNRYNNHPDNLRIVDLPDRGDTDETHR